MPGQNRNFIKKEARDKKAAMSARDDEENVCLNVRSSCFVCSLLCKNEPFVKQEGLDDCFWSCIIAFLFAVILQLALICCELCK